MYNAQGNSSRPRSNERGDGQREGHQLVGDYQSSLDWLWILHMFSYGMSKRHIYETADEIFGENKDEVVDKIEADLEECGILFRRIARRESLVRYYNQNRMASHRAATGRRSWRSA